MMTDMEAINFEKVVECLTSVLIFLLNTDFKKKALYYSIWHIHVHVHVLRGVLLILSSSGI